MVSAKKYFAALIAGGLLTAGVANAQISITVGDEAGAVGGTVTVMFDYAAMDADDVGGFQFDLTYDPVALTPTDVTMCGVNAPATHSAACTEPGGPGMGTVRTLIADFIPPTAEIMPLAIAPFGQFTFMINQPGVHTLTFTNGVGADVNAANVAINGNNATITGNIVGAAGYASTPAPGATIDFGDVLVGVTSSMPAAINVTETGDQQLDVMAPAFGAGTDFASATGAFSIVDGGPAVDVEVSCTPTARGNLADTVNLNNNSVNDPMPQYNLTCNGTSPNVMVAPTTVTLTGIIGQADPTDSFTVSNPQDGSTSDALNAMLSSAPDAPEISIDDGLDDTTISVDETDTVTVSCSTAAPGMFTETITVTWDDIGGPMTQDVVVNCEIINEIAEYESIPAEGSTLDFGAVLSGVQSAPLGIDIGNTDTDAIPNGTLSITGATIAGPDAGVFSLDTSPVGTMIPANVGPDGTDDAVLSCTPTDTFSTFNATLTIDSNDPDTPHVYNLTCMGDSDAAFDSNPVSGSTVDFGFLLPGMDADETIVFSNTGTVEDLTAASCTLTADPEFTLVSPVFPATIPAGGTLDVVLNCAAGAPGLFTGSLSCDIQNGQAMTVASPVFDLRCTGAAVEVPTLSRFGLIALVMTLMMGGFIAFRLRQN